MPSDEIEVPKEVRQFMPEWAEETILGKRNGAKKQYRHGRLHIREYEDRFLVHMDRVDPRKNPLGHLIHDAPEVLVGIACGAIGGSVALYKKPNLLLAMASSLICGYLGYRAAEELKKHKR